MVRTCIVLAALAWSRPALAEKAVLECTADTWVARGQASPGGREAELAAPKGGTVLFAFRIAAVEGWRIAKATLLLHVKSGARPGTLRIAPIGRSWSEAGATWEALELPRGRTRPARSYQEDWVAVELQPADLGPQGVAVSGAGARISARESVGHAPYLLVEGSR